MNDLTRMGVTDVRELTSVAREVKHSLGKIVQDYDFMLYKLQMSQIPETDKAFVARSYEHWLQREVHNLLR